MSDPDRESEHDRGRRRDPDAAAWARAGIPHDEVAGWVRWRIGPRDARAWRQAGVADGLTAAQWQTAGVTPSTVDDWRDAGIAPNEAVVWHEMGFDLAAAKEAKDRGDDPTAAMEARDATRRGFTMSTGAVHALGPMPKGTAGDPVQKFLRSGADQRLLHEYMQHRWMDDDAIAWARQGIGAAEAYLWHDLGLTPAEAGRLQADGHSVGDVVRDWWAAGIPVDEVADWIGAGLSPAEAVEQRAAGVTVDEAAALRALRRDEEAPPAGPHAALLGRMGPPGNERRGPPPADEPAARAAVTDAFIHMFTARDPDGGLARVDGGANLGPSADAAGERIGGHPSTVVTVTVTAVRFLNDHEARALYDLDVRGGMTTRLSGQLGGAVLVDGVWKVARETVTQLLGLAGVTCPPRPADG
jgi:hypothetical protein